MTIDGYISGSYRKKGDFTSNTLEKQMCKFIKDLFWKLYDVILSIKNKGTNKCKLHIKQVIVNLLKEKYHLQNKGQ